MTTRFFTIGAALISGLALTTGTAADEITAAGVHYTGVLVQATDSLYYVQTPEDGNVLTVPKDQVVPDSVKITENVAERAAIRTAWRANNATSQKELAHEGRKLSIEAQAASSESQLQGSDATTLRLRGREGAALQAEMRSNGYVPYIKLSEVPLGQALDAILRPMGLEYKVYGDIVYVSTPELLRRESFEGMETRQYTVNGDDTMHKIVLRNPFSVTGNAQIAGGFAGGGQFGGAGGGFGGQGGGFGGGGFGGQGGGFGGGGFGGQGGGFGGGGFGGQGGGGFGGQGGGGFGGGGGGSSDVTATSNISELFSNIDDRLVGEAPATIGGGYYAQPKSSSFRPGNGNGNLNRGAVRGR